MPTRKSLPPSERGQVQPKGAPERLPSSASATATPPPQADYSNAVKDVTIDVLLRRAFPHGQWANVGDWLEQQSLAPEVKAEIAAAVERNR